MHPFSSFLHQVHEWPPLYNHQTINGGEQQQLMYDLNRYRVQNQNLQHDPTIPIYNNHIYMYPSIPDVLELSGDLYPRPRNYILNDFELPTRQWQATGATVPGRDTIFSMASSSTVDHSTISVETLDQWGKDIAVKTSMSPHLPTSPSPSTPTATPNQAVSSKQFHTLVELRTASPGLFPTQLIQKISLHESRCRLARCTFPHKKFSSAEAVIEHIRTEDIPQRDRRAVWCSCNKWFASRNNGKRHVITENAGKQYGCSECPQRFKRKDQTKTHLSAKHGILI